MRKFRVQLPQGTHTLLDPGASEWVCCRSVPPQTPRAEIQKLVWPHAAPDRLHLVGHVQQVTGKLLHVLERCPHQRPEDFFGNDLSFAPKRTGILTSELGG